jgi:pantothenate kinase type III
VKESEGILINFKTRHATIATGSTVSLTEFLKQVPEKLLQVPISSTPGQTPTFHVVIKNPKEIGIDSESESNNTISVEEQGTE